MSDKDAWFTVEELARQDPILFALLKRIAEPTEDTLRTPYQRVGWLGIKRALNGMGIGTEIPHRGWFCGRHTLARLVKWRADTLRIYADWLAMRLSSVKVPQ